MKKTMFMVLFGAFALMIIVTLTVRSVIITSFYDIFTPTFEETLMQSAFSVADKVADQFIDDPDSNLVSVGNMTFIESLGRMRVWIAKTNGTIIYDNRPNGSWEGRPLPSIYLQTLQTDAIYDAKGPSPWDNKERSVVGVTILKDNKPFGYVLLFSRGNEWQALRTSLDKLLLWSGLVSLLIGLFITLWLSRSLLAPIGKIHEYVKHLGQKNFDYRIEKPNIQELSVLVSSLEEISAQLKHSFQSIRKQEKILRVILEQMVEGVLVVNQKMQIVIMNEAFSDYFNIKPQSFMSIKLSGLPEELIHGISDFVLTGNNEKEISYKGRIFHSSFSLLRWSEKQDELTPSYVIVVRDITEQRQSELIRQQFIANVSHELRTPLSGISSIVEALKDGVVPPPQHQLKYLDLLYLEAQRMSRMTTDLIEISRMDQISANKEIPLLDVVDLKPLIENVVWKLSKRFQDRRQFCHVNLENVSVLGLHDAIEQIFLNLLDNAIRFSPSGKEITVTIGKMTKEELTVVVADQGIGIPEEALPRIWDRFYKVDEARTRDLGGSGLGLSIVKQLIERQLGRIDVDSKIGKGTRFTLTFRRSENHG